MMGLLQKIIVIGTQYIVSLQMKCENTKLQGRDKISPDLFLLSTAIL
jgi:hypothetical protein